MGQLHGNQSAVCVCIFKKVKCNIYLLLCVCVCQYYEMSYGLNVEMHKQVCNLMLLVNLDCFYNNHQYRVLYCCQ